MWTSLVLNMGTRTLPRVVVLSLTLLFAGLPDEHLKAQGRTILAVGAHAGDMEITAGAVLAKHAQEGDRVVILHLTLGEEGNPRLTSEAYGKQKKEEALEAARKLGVEARFGPFTDGQIPNDDTAKLLIVESIREIKPSLVITHWKNSFHNDHRITHRVVVDSVLMASLPGVKTQHPPHRGIRGLYFTENWEDEEEFDPYVFVDVSDHMEEWESAVQTYEFIKGGISSFPYLEYYKSLARVRGALAGSAAAVAFDTEAHAKKRILDRLP